MVIVALPAVSEEEEKDHETFILEVQKTIKELEGIRQSVTT